MSTPTQNVTQLQTTTSGEIGNPLHRIVQVDGHLSGIEIAELLVGDVGCLTELVLEILVSSRCADHSRGTLYFFEFFSRIAFAQISLFLALNYIDERNFYF